MVTWTQMYMPMGGLGPVSYTHLFVGIEKD